MGYYEAVEVVHKIYNISRSLKYYEGEMQERMRTVPQLKSAK
jgi:hypothetical protein